MFALICFILFVSGISSGKESMKREQNVLPTVKRISKGYSPHSRAWMAYILVIHPKTSGTSICGGSILNKKFLVTAAHCFCASNLCQYVKNKTRPTVARGDLKMNDHIKVLVGGHPSAQKAKGTNRTVTAIFIHPDFDGVYNDLAIIELADSLQFSPDEISPICLPKENLDLIKPAGTAVVAGWGSTSDPFCSTDGQGPAKYQRCRLPFKFTDPDTEQLSTFDSCTFAPPPGYKNPLCVSFYQGLHLYNPFPKFPVELRVENKSVVICRNNSHGLYGWCGTLTQSEMINSIDNINGTPIIDQPSKDPGKTKLEDDELLGIKESKNWGWCESHCQRSSDEGSDYSESDLLGGRPSLQESSNSYLKNGQGSLQEAVLTIMGTKECFEFGQYMDSETKTILQINSSSEFCAAKQNPEQIPEVWIGKETKEDIVFTYKGPEPTPSKFFYGGTDSCKGDSGGPLWIWQGKPGKERAVMIGLVSRGKGCGLHNMAGIYTNILNFLAWIRGIIKTGNCEKQ